MYLRNIVVFLNHTTRYDNTGKYKRKKNKN